MSRWETVGRFSQETTDGYLRTDETPSEVWTSTRTWVGSVARARFVVMNTRMVLAIRVLLVSLWTTSIDLVFEPARLVKGA
jgi:hypothetical protein